MKLYKQIVCSLCLFLSLSPLLYAQEVTLKDGELFEVRNGSGQLIKITSTKGKVDEFWLSLNKRYIAYSKIIEYADEPGLWEDQEEIPQRPACHIIILDLRSKKTLAEISPQNENDSFIYVDGWVSDKELLLHDADGFAVSNFYSYDLTKKELKEIQWEEYKKKEKELKTIMP